VLRLIDRPAEWRPSGPIVRAEEYRALLDAEGLLEDARGEAARIVAEGQAEFERQRELGLALGRRQAAEERAALALEASAETIRSLRNAEEKLVDLVVKTARKVIGEIDVRERAPGLIRTALTSLTAEGKAKIRVAAEDLPAARDAIRGTGASADEFVELAVDPRLKPGACVLETPSGVIDAGLDVQLAAIERSLRRAAFGANAEAGS
jgi:type III secretion protein L